MEQGGRQGCKSIQLKSGCRHPIRLKREGRRNYHYHPPWDLPEAPAAKQAKQERKRGQSHFVTTAQLMEDCAKPWPATTCLAPEKIRSSHDHTPRRGGGAQPLTGATRVDSLPAAGRWFLLPPLPWEPPMHLGSAEPTGGLGRIAERSRGVTKPRARKGEREAGDTCSWGTAQDDRVSEPAAKRGAISSPLREPPRQEENRGRAEGEPPPLRGIYEGQPQGRVLSPPPDGARATTGGETAPTAGAAARRRSTEKGRVLEEEPRNQEGAYQEGRHKT